MKKILLFFVMVTIAIAAKAQNEYKATNGVTYKIGDTVRLGRGSAPNGSFLYLQLGGWAAAMNTGGGDQNNIGKGYANTAVVIKKIKSGKMKGIVKYYFVVGGGNLSNYNLIIDDAIQACEVVPCASSAPVQSVTIQQSDDKFDQLKKLKALLDSGAITQSEYDEQKKKILGN